MRMGRGGELCIPTVEGEPWPCPRSTNLCVACLTQAAGAVAPAAGHNDLVTLREPSGFGHEAADLFHGPGDLMTWSHGKHQWVVVLEITIHELSVRATHASRRDFDQDLIGGHVRHCDIFEDERLLVAMHACGAHWHFLLPSTFP